MKKTLTIIAILAVVLLTAIVLAFRFTSGLAGAADKLFEAAANNDVQQIEELLSEGFVAITPVPELVNWMQARGFDRVEETRWTNRESSGGAGSLRGSVITTNGGTYPVEIQLVKENGRWKIHSMETPETGISQKSVEVGLSGEEIFQLTDRSMQLFVESLKHGSMDHFRRNVAEAWQADFTTDQMNQAYASFIDLVDELGFVHEVMPEVEYYTPDEDGIMKVIGDYSTEQAALHFDLYYIKEEGQWMLIGLHVSLR